MIDELADWGARPPVVVADAGYGDNGFFRTALTIRGLAYITQVKTITSRHPGDAVYGMPEYSGQGRPRKPGYRTKPSGLRFWHSPCLRGSIAACPGGRVVKAY